MQWLKICTLCLKFAFCRKLIYALFLCDGTCKPLLTSKPSLTIALKISKTIEKPSKPMVGPSKNIQWWWSNGIKTIEKPLKSMVAWKKNINHSIALKNWPSSWSIGDPIAMYIQIWNYESLTHWLTFALYHQVYNIKSRNVASMLLHWVGMKK